MIRALSLTLVAAMACGRASGVSDEELGSLVIEPKQPPKAIDTARVADDRDELARALARPYAQVLASLGPHVVSLNTRTTVEEAGKVVSELSDHAVIENGEGGAFHGLYTSSADYGRETTFVGNKLYLRPRYQRWHERAPETPAEPSELRDAYYGAIGATWDLVGHAAELTDRGRVQVAGRGGRKIEVKLSPSPARAPRETLAQRKWREGSSVEALAGEVVLDAETGAPLALKLAGTVAFSREGRSFVMKLELDSTVSAIGVPVAIAAPPEGEVVATPGRLREVDERDYLLQGIAPPLRKSADGTALPPPKPTTDDKPKADDKPKSEAKSDDKPKPEAKSDDKPKTEDKSDDQPKGEAKPEGPP